MVVLSIAAILHGGVCVGHVVVIVMTCVLKSRMVDLLFLVVVVIVTCYHHFLCVCVAATDFVLCAKGAEALDFRFGV